MEERPTAPMGQEQATTYLGQVSGGQRQNGQRETENIEQRNGREGLLHIVVGTY